MPGQAWPALPPIRATDNKPGYVRTNATQESEQYKSPARQQSAERAQLVWLSPSLKLVAGCQQDWERPTSLRFPFPFHFAPNRSTERSSNQIGVPEKGLPNTEAQPATGSSFSSNATVHFSGSAVPFGHTLTSTFHSPSLTFRTCKRSRVHSPGFQSNAMLVFTSWSLKSSSA